MTGWNLLFIRHGEAANVEGRCVGHTDVPLSPTGIATMHMLANACASAFLETRPPRIISSDLRRAVDSAEILASVWGVSVEHDPRLREMNFGVWDGSFWSDIEAADNARLNTWMAAWPETVTPHGEGVKDVFGRAESWLNSLEHDERSPDDWIFVVAHAGWIRAALCLLLERSVADMFAIPVDHARVTAVRVEASGSELIASNIDAAALSGMFARRGRST